MRYDMWQHTLPITNHNSSTSPLLTMVPAAAGGPIHGTHGAARAGAQGLQGARCIHAGGDRERAQHCAPRRRQCAQICRARCAPQHTKKYCCICCACAKEQLGVQSCYSCSLSRRPKFDMLHRRKSSSAFVQLTCAGVHSSAQSHLSIAAHTAIMRRSWSSKKCCGVRSIYSVRRQG